MYVGSLMSHCQMLHPAGSSGAQTLAERKSQEAGVLMLDGDSSGDYTSTGGSVLLNLASTLGEFDLPSHGELARAGR